MQKLGIYVHIPYCPQKCRYCDFTSGKICDAALDPDAYANRVCEEIEHTANRYIGTDECVDITNYSVDSIFFGGGTPTCIGTDLIGRILICIKNNFRVEKNAEISIEANPETINEKKASILRFLGFNRISMGVQSLDDDVLSIMGRVHDADRARQAYKALRKAGFENINLDLMFGVPGQTFDIWKRTLDEVILLDPEHISFYGLQLEEGTPFYEDYRLGKLDIPSWDENRKMYHYAVDALKRSGYHHYEISNAAKPGKECRHNIKYWTMQPYLGFGTSAHSFVDDRRFFNTDEYVYNRRSDDNTDLETDRIFTGFRLVDGLDFGEDLCKKYAGIIEKLTEEQMIIKDGTNLRFTDKGLDNTNNVLTEFINFNGGTTWQST